MFRLSELRQMSGITQKQLAQHLGVSQNTLSYWESGKFEPDISTLINISKFFNVTVDYLVGVSDNATSLGIGANLAEAIKSDRELSEESRKVLSTQYQTLLELENARKNSETAKLSSYASAQN